jgi:hypothetical protein
MPGAFEGIANLHWDEACFGFPHFGENVLFLELLLILRHVRIE